MSKKKWSDGVSIITCTKRPQCVHNLFNNYKRQIAIDKELIIILNHDGMDINQYINLAKCYRNVRVYQLPGTTSLGRCLNFGVTKARFKYVAKFDDDDYYSPYYLREGLRAFRSTNADIVGKRTMFMYLKEKKLLLIRRPGNENKYSNRVVSATILAKKDIFKTVKFPDRSIGEGPEFLNDCSEKGFKIYSTSRYNFVANRRKDHKSHTWQITYDVLLKQHCKIVSHTNQYQVLARMPF
ncbi:glycosyltransferase [Desmospora profundinema]|uniref:Glycosyltransferase involved in cell wall biosynthesis n=1 Tax=Desmospora profundinema TaxID=1571184 RepID=A0ABU1ILM3_9BACL|nr:glycosyltransferase [Desmospora profundinema]MDR6225675.1 glycosyltransferase involved in cell wall biosynthesis [Desmospora profundinema]